MSSRNNEERSAIVSGAGFVSDLMIKLTKAVEKRGAEPSCLHVLVRPKGEKTLDKIAAIIIQDCGQIFPENWDVSIFPIKPSAIESNMVSLLKDWKATSGLSDNDYINPRINEANFPTGKNSLPTGCEIVLVKFNKYMTIEEALREGQAQGLRRPTIQEGIIFATQYPDIQKKITIIVPHIPQSFSRDYPDQPASRYCLLLSGSQRGRQLHLRSDNSTWIKFMFVRDNQILPANG